MREREREKISKEDFAGVRVCQEHSKGKAGNSYARGRLSTVDLLVLTSLDQLLLY